MNFLVGNTFLCLSTYAASIFSFSFSLFGVIFIASKFARVRLQLFLFPVYIYSFTMPQLEEGSISPSEEVVVEFGGEECRFRRPRYESPWLNSPPSHGGRNGRPPSQKSDDAEIEHADPDELSDESDSIASPDDTPPPEPEPEPGWAVHPFGGMRTPIIRSKDDPPDEEPSPTASERARWREVDRPETRRQRIFDPGEQEYVDAMYERMRERGWSPVEQEEKSESATHRHLPNQELVMDVSELRS